MLVDQGVHPIASHCLVALDNTKQIGGPIADLVPFIPHSFIILRTRLTRLETDNIPLLAALGAAAWRHDDDVVHTLGAEAGTSPLSHQTVRSI